MSCTLIMTNKNCFVIFSILETLIQVYLFSSTRLSLKIKTIFPLVLLDNIFVLFEQAFIFPKVIF